MTCGNISLVFFIWIVFILYFDFIVRDCRQKY